MIRKISIGLIIVVVLFSVLSHSYAEESALGSAEQWEDMALLRMETARGHELQAKGKNESAFKDGVGNYETIGEVLTGAGDEKLFASEEYQKASEHWKKVVGAYKTVGEVQKAEAAQDKADSVWEAAKRTLRESVDLYKIAAAHYENGNNLAKNIEALKSVARNLESLVEME